MDKNPMLRRRFLRTLLTGPLGLTAMLLPDAAHAIIIPGLRDRLESDLRPRMPSDYDFIDRVIDLVKKDMLPVSIVERTYLWARQKRTNRMQYFQLGLRSQAKKLGLTI